MPNVDTGKQRLLYVYEFLKEHTDIENQVQMKDILLYLDDCGIKADRRAVYSDIRALQDFGIDIVSGSGKFCTYYYNSKDFEIAELKLLVDAVQASKFITSRKSQNLIKKIENLTNKNKAQQLQRQVVVANRVKGNNEKIYNNIDQINQAINEKLQIKFYYLDWMISGTEIKKIRRRDGKIYKVSPKTLMWDDENYYLIAYDNLSCKIKHYRVDKMEHIIILDEECINTRGLESFNVAKYARQTFGMYGGKETTVRIRFDNSLLGVVFDRFSSNINIVKSDKNHFEIKVTVMLSVQFYAWLFSFGDKVKLLSPKSAIDEYVKYLEKVKGIY